MQYIEWSKTLVYVYKENHELGFKFGAYHISTVNDTFTGRKLTMTLPNYYIDIYLVLFYYFIKNTA